MIKSRFTLPLGAAALTLAGTLLLAGCGKGDEQTTRFNTVLGDSAAPTSPGVIDRGILSDPANYKPAARSGDLGAGGGGAPSGGGGDVAADASLSPEAQAVVRSITVMTEDVFAMNAAGVMAGFDPVQIEALTKNDFESSLSNLFSAVDLTYKTIKSKLPPDQQAALTTVFSLAPKAVQVLSGRPRVEFSEDGTTATVFNDPPSPEAIKAFVSANAQPIIDAARTIASSGWAPIDSEQVGMIESLTPENLPAMIEPMLAGLEAARTAAEAAGGAPQGTKMKKVGDRWVVVLPGAVNEELADLLKEGVDLAREALTAMQAQIDAAPALNQELVQQISANLMTGTLPQFMGWFGRFQAMMMEMGGEAGEQPPATEPAEEKPPVNPRQPSGGDGPINP